ncbi:recombinase RecT [Selenomonas artemidis]|uniref:recombinase RecT n=1 Tax=Selenomonas artemidis TaxID=671224 RepID=UPI0023F235CE|nr:recombinase RecT [Selenomonas artemidis]
MTQSTNQAVATTNTAALEAPQANMSERFMQKVVHEFSGSVGEFQITEYQRQLIQGYFIGVDRALKTAEAERVRKNENNRDHKYDNTVPVTWANVNMADLALDVVHYARLGLDTMQANFITPIPYLNKKAGRYDINLMLGYNGIKYIAEKFALCPPKSVTIELVYSTDNFKPYKKGHGNDVESYDFEITNPFDRGHIVGGFGYIEYDDPKKNELVLMSMKDIEKRKPEYASANFWGGKANEWKDGKRVEVDKDGWLDEMCRKTLIREVYSPKHILLDPRKVDDSYQYMKQREARLAEAQGDMRRIIDVTANSVPVEQVKELPTQVAAPQLSLGIPAPTLNADPQTAVAYREPVAPPIADEPPAEEAAADGLYAGMDF